MDIDLESAIEEIGRLPDMLIPRGINFDTPAEKEIIRLIKVTYEGKREWLKNILLEQSLSPEIFDVYEEWQYCKPNARLSVNLLRLIERLYPHSPQLQKIDYGQKAINFIWLSSQIYECRALLKTSGITGQSQLMGKVDLIKLRRKYLDVLDECTIRLDFVENQKDIQNIITFQEAPDIYLEGLAGKVIRKNGEFGDNCWQPYKEEQESVMRNIRDCKNLQYCCLVGNEIFTTGKGKKPPKSVRFPKKAFGK